MARLFRLKSVFDHFSHRGKVYDGVEICWFVVYRDTPINSHRKLLNGYLTNPDNSQYISEDNIYELFTEEEAEAFKEYLLKNHREQCQLREADIRSEVNSWGYGDKILSYREGFYRLDHEGDYNLPFIVWGYYDLSYAKDVSWLIYGVESIERILDKFGMTVTDLNILKTKIEEMKNQGLFVERETGNKERITN
jgi:hypothetical protein